VAAAVHSTNCQAIAFAFASMKVSVGFRRVISASSRPISWTTPRINMRSTPSSGSARNSSVVISFVGASVAMCILSNACWSLILSQ
jgi:hypothetical protein